MDAGLVTKTMPVKQQMAALKYTYFRSQRLQMAMEILVFALQEKPEILPTEDVLTTVEGSVTEYRPFYKKISQRLLPTSHTCMKIDGETFPFTTAWPLYLTPVTTCHPAFNLTLHNGILLEKTPSF